MRLELINIEYKISSEIGIKIDKLNIQNGEMIAITGKTGSGKTTLLNLISGLTHPDKGIIYYGGKDISKKDGIALLRRDLSYAFQFPERTIFERTVKREILFSLRKEKLPNYKVEELLKKTLKMVDLDESFLERNPFALSGGEKRKVALASLLIKNPKVLLIDEPIAGLDPVSRDSFLDLLDKINSEGCTIIMVTHSAEAATRVKRIIALERGTIKYDGPAEKVLLDRYTAFDIGLVMPSAAEISQILYQKGYNIKVTCNRKELIDEVKRVIRKDESGE